VATKEQFDFFKLLHDEETARYRDLIDRGKTYISLLTLYGAFLAFSLKDAVPSGAPLFALFVLLVLSFLAKPAALPSPQIGRRLAAGGPRLAFFLLRLICLFTPEGVADGRQQAAAYERGTQGRGGASAP
jgi:hypothetical protein